MVTTKEYYERNKEKIKAYRVGYRARNPGKERMKNKLWREANPEKTKLYMAKYSATPKGRLTKLRLRAKYGNIPIDIELREFTKWYECQELKCHYCYIQTSTAPGQKKLDGLSIDRKDNGKGYTLDNIVFCCNRCNMAKGSWFTEKEMLEIAEKYFR